MCLSLLSVQMSGLHLHVNIGGQGSADHGTHLHHGDHDGHEYDVDVEVSPSEPATAWSKLTPFLLTLLFALLTVVRAGKTVWLPMAERMPTRYRSRWRPPLRAPPRHTH